MGQEAIKIAMREAGIGWNEVDYIIDCSTSKYRTIPCNAAHIQQAIGPAASSIPCVDIQSTCLGSIVAINTANALLANGVCRNVLIVASEAAMKAINWSDPESAGLIGDGAAALVLKREAMKRTLGFAHETYAEHLELCKIEGGGHCLDPTHYSSRPDDFRFSMDGPAVFRVALKRLPPMVNQLREEYESASEHANPLHVIPHQASPKAVKIIRRVLNIPKSNYHVAIEGMGNIAAASLPIMLDQTRKNGAVNSGDSVMMLGTSAGYSQAALIFEI
jgi:3-oxoacyl-[acyl-carrier-protein] synthase-3